MVATRESNVHSRQRSGSSQLRQLLAAKEREFAELAQCSFEELEREV
jgi:hypothetical protein